MVDEHMLEEVHEKFKEKLENCENCITHQEEHRICRKHKMMIAKYVRKKYDATIKEMASMMAKGLLNKNGEKDE